MFADTLITNGQVYTMDASLPTAEAVGLAGNRILALGSANELRGLRGPATEIIDLAGRIVLPAFADSHIHFLNMARARRHLDLSTARSAEEIASAVAGRAAATPPGHWVFGNGWDRNVWLDTSLPTRRLLDAASPDHPVALHSKDLHSTWVNSLALAQAGFTSATPDPAGGVIVRESLTGEPTGILLERACKVMADVYPPPTPEECAGEIKSAMPEAWQSGITSIHQMGDRPDGRAFRAFQLLHQRGELSLRVLYYLPRENLEAAVQLGLRSGFGDQRLRIGGVKLFADGSLGSHTAWMLEPFSDEPLNRGVPWLDPQELREIVGYASRSGLAVAVHALGDRANREVIDAVAAARRHEEERPESAGPLLRHRIEHAQLLHPDDIPRLARHGLIASMQPIHCTSDMIMADKLWGEPRCAGAYAWRSMLDASVPLAFGSDGPVEPLDVLQGIHAAVSRCRADGSPGPGGWHSEQRLSVVEAVHGYTLGAAHAAGEETERGSITPGKLADLVVLSDDIFKLQPERILDTRVDMTFFDARVVYRR